MLIMLCYYPLPLRWSEMRDAFQVLVKDVQWNIRRTLSYSLHELARILSKRHTSSTTNTTTTTTRFGSGPSGIS